MLHIILTILKCIGIILAVILGIIVLLVSIVLLVPMRYKVKAQCDGTKKGFEACARVSWMCHLVSGYAIFEDEKFSWQMRVLWKKLNVEKKTKKVPEKAEPSKMQNISQTSEKYSKPVEVQDKAEVQQKAESKTTSETKTKTVSKNSRKSKHQTILQKIKYTFQKICDKIKVLFRKKEKLEEFISDTIHRSAFARIWQEIVRLGRFLRPKKMKMNVHFGFEDPYHTGRVLALLSMLYPFYGEYISVDPDFEEQILEGDLFIKGHIHGIYAVIIAWNLFFDKNIRTAYKHIRAFEF